MMRANLMYLEENEAFIYSYFIQNELFLRINQKKNKNICLRGQALMKYLLRSRKNRRWLGWKIVSSYMDQNQITLEELLLEVTLKNIL